MASLSVREKHPLLHQERKRVKPNTAFRRIPPRISRRREILHRPRLRLFILNLPRRGGNRGTSLPCNFRSFSPPSPSHRPRRNSLQQHSRPSPSIIYHFETSKMLLSAPVLEKFHPQSLRARQCSVHEIRRRSQIAATLPEILECVPPIISRLAPTRIKLRLFEN